MKLNNGGENETDLSLPIRWGMAIAFVLAITFILPKNHFLNLNYSVGKLWTGPDLKSTFGFPIFLDGPELEEKRKLARENVKPHFSYVTDGAKNSKKDLQASLDTYFDELSNYLMLKDNDPENAAQFRLDRINTTFFPDSDSLISSPRLLKKEQTRMNSVLRRMVTSIYKRGLMDWEPKDLPTELITVRLNEREQEIRSKSSLYGPSSVEDICLQLFPNQSALQQRLNKRLILSRIQPNYVYSKALYEQALAASESGVLETEGYQEKGLIIQRGENITHEKDRILRSYSRARQERFANTNPGSGFVRKLLVVGLITMLLVLFFRFTKARVFYRNRRMAMIYLFFILMVSLYSFVLNLSSITLEHFELHYVYLVPACLVPIILSAFFDSRVASFGNVLIAMYAGLIVPNGFEYFFVQLVAGTVATYSIAKLSTRQGFFFSLSLIFLAYCVSFFAISFYSSAEIQNIHQGNFLLFLFNCLLTLLAYPLIYLFEKIFGLTSDLTYVELLDMNHPLMKELSVSAPGTYQHSLQVANISESVVSYLGGNTLLTKVGALFHDIGKLKNPQCFIENLSGPNPHQNLSDHESAAVIIEHVREGVKLARSYNLPREIIEFIKTHHGTCRTEYFYRNHCHEHPGMEIDEDEFRYPGPKPFTKEQAVVMIVDSVEAAIRALKEKRPEDFPSFVEKIVESKVKLRQFDKADITFKELELVKDIIIRQLKGIYHPRIEYPAE